MTLRIYIAFFAVVRKLSPEHTSGSYDCGVTCRINPSNSRYVVLSKTLANSVNNIKNSYMNNKQHMFDIRHCQIIGSYYNVNIASIPNTTTGSRCPHNSPITQGRNTGGLPRICNSPGTAYT